MTRYFYAAPIQSFHTSSTQEILGTIVQNSSFPDEPTQKEAWLQQIYLLKKLLIDLEGTIYFEYIYPKNGKADRCCSNY